MFKRKRGKYEETSAAHPAFKKSSVSSQTLAASSIASYVCLEIQIVIHDGGAVSGVGHLQGVNDCR